MKMKKEVLVLVLVIAALSVYIAVKKKGRTNYEIPVLPVIEKAEISRLTIRKGGTETTLVQVGEGWVVRPGDYPADKMQVEGMLDSVTGLTLTAVASEAGNDALYELDEEKRIEVEAGKGDQVLRSIVIGKTAPTQRHTFVRLASGGPIYHALQTLRNPFEKSVEQLRDKQAMKIDGDVGEITLTEGKKSIRIGKAAAPAAPESEADASQEPKEGADVAKPEWRTADGKPVNGDDVDALIKTLSDLKCDGYVKDRKREEEKNPTFTVSLRGAKEYVFSVYREEDKKFVCTSSESAYVFLIPEWRMKKIRLDLDELLKTDKPTS